MGFGPISASSVTPIPRYSAAWVLLRQRAGGKGRASFCSCSSAIAPLLIRPRLGLSDRVGTLQGGTVIGTVVEPCLGPCLFNQVIREGASLRDAIEAIQADFPKAGYRTVQCYLRRRGRSVGERRIRRVMKQFSLHVEIKRAFIHTTDSNHAHRV